jgi:putative endonuclease
MSPETSDSGEVWSVYLIRCRDGCYYVGIAHDVQARYRRHCQGRAARFTKARGVDCLIGAIAIGSRAEATRVERQLKKCKPNRKLSYFFNDKLDTGIDQADGASSAVGRPGEVG